MASTLLSFFEASEQLQLFIHALAEAATPPQKPAESVSLASAAGRVLAEAVRADRDQPPFARSTRDGFACRSAEASTNQLLSLAGHLRAGETPRGNLQSGEVWEIMTGAPVPEGADAVFMVEHSEHSSNFIRLAAPRTLQAGENIVPRGAEAHAGDLLLSLGARLGPAQIAIAAQCGYDQLSVATRPRVAILSTGDELVPVEGRPGPSQIRNSNSPMLAALVTAGGGEPIVLPVVSDQDELLDFVIAKVVSTAVSADMLLITGGISAGRFDLVEGALTRAGARFFFGGVAIQPGKPVSFGQLVRADGQPLPFFALPGNPISSAVTFHLFAAPLMAALGDDSTPLPRFALARLAGEWRGKPGLTRFLPAWCDFGPASEVRLIPWQGSGDIAAFARANCFVVIPPEAGAVEEGSLVQILLT